MQKPKIKFPYRIAMNMPTVSGRPIHLFINRHSQNKEKNHFCEHKRSIRDIACSL